MTSGVSTSKAISPDSGEHWSLEGAWQVAEGLHRIPLPLPMDGLRAVNVYVLETAEGLTLIDGGWAITEGRTALETGLKEIGRTFADIRRFLVTHVHRDHYSLARVLGTEYGADVTLGRGEKPTMDMLLDPDNATGLNMVDQLRAAGAHEIAEIFESMEPDDGRDNKSFNYPDTWLEATSRSRSASAP